MIEDIDKIITQNKEIKELRVSVDNYKKLVREFFPNAKEEELLFTPLFYRGIKITFGVKFKGDK